MISFFMFMPTIKHICKRIQELFLNNMKKNKSKFHKKSDINLG